MWVAPTLCAIRYTHVRKAQRPSKSPRLPPKLNMYLLKEISLLLAICLVSTSETANSSAELCSGLLIQRVLSIRIQNTLLLSLLTEVVFHGPLVLT